MMARMKVRFLLVFATLVLGLLVNTPTFAQESGRLSGVLLDPQNAVVVRALATVANDKRKYIAYSDDSGRFQFEIPAGSYKVSVDSSGFRQYVIEITVSAGWKNDLSISLLPATISYDDCYHCIGPFREIEKIDAPAPQEIPARKIQ